MIHIPADDVRVLFDQNKDENWSGLRQVLKQRQGKAEGIEDSIIDTLLVITPILEQSNEPYPGSAEQMQRVLEDALNRVTA